MSPHSRRRIERSYSGTVGDLWQRIGLEQPTGYWEENVVLGRRRVRAVLLDWMRPLEGRRVIDAGCGCGTMALALAAQGAQVTGADLVDRFPRGAGRRVNRSNPTFLVGDFRQLLLQGPYDDVLLQEVWEDYPTEEWPCILRSLRLCRNPPSHKLRSPPPRLYLVHRTEPGASAWIRALLPQALRATVDSVALLRSIHLHTPYRLVRQSEVSRRNYRVRILELIRGTDDGETDRV